MIFLLLMSSLLILLRFTCMLCIYQLNIVVTPLLSPIPININDINIILTSMTLIIMKQQLHIGFIFSYK